MKKIGTFFLLLAAIIVWSYTIAQENNNLGNETNVEKQVQVGMTIPDQTKLSYINIAFCNDGIDNLTKNGLLTIRPWQTKEICMVFSNTSKDESADIIATFVDTELSNEGNMVCSLWINNTGKMLASYISFNKEEYVFTLEPWKTVIKKATLHMPKNAELWMYNGCVGYQLNVKQKDDDKWIFFVVRRRVGLMEIIVEGDVYKFWWLDTIKYMYQNNKIVVLRTLARIIGIVLVLYIIIMMRWKKQDNKKKTKK